MRVITTLLIALVALTGWGCAKKVPNDPYKQEMAKVLMNKGRLVQDLARPENVHLSKIEGIALIRGLHGTGADEPPSTYQQLLLQDMLRDQDQKRTAKSQIASLDTAIALLETVVPPGARKGDRLDVNVKLLTQFALMGSLYLECAYGIERPRVALLNIGAEAEKGDELRKEAYPVFETLKGIHFVGNMESRDLLSGKYDLVVCDGFSGNVLIKSTEGACLEMLKKLKRDIYSRTLYKIGALLMKRMFDEEKKFMDYRSYGGSVLLGCKKLVVKGHGSSNADAVKACILQAYRMQDANLTEKIQSAIASAAEAEK